MMETQAQTRIVTSNTIHGNSDNSSISNDGRYIVFESYSDYNDLFFPNITDYNTNIFIRDLYRDTINLISKNSISNKSNGDSRNADVSGDGRYVVFESDANNLINNDSLEDNGGYKDIFLWNLDTKTNQRINLAYNGFQANSSSYNPKISDNGRYVIFESDASNLVRRDSNYDRDIFIRDLVDNTTKKVSLTADNYQSNSDSYNANISANGHYVVFESDADNLVEDDTNYDRDIFIRDLVDNTTKRVSLGNDGSESNYNSYNPDVSIDGRYVVFESYADNLVADDTNDSRDIFVRDLFAHTTKRVSVSNDIFGTQGNSGSYNPSISADGRYVVFESYADNLVSGDTNNSKDIFVRDLIANTTERISRTNNPEDSQANNDSYNASISVDGHYVVFESYASNLTIDDKDDYSYSKDIFVRDLGVDFSDSIASEEHKMLLTDVHRFYEYERGFHLYTSDFNEIDYIKRKRSIGELAYNYEAEKYQVLADNKDMLTGEEIEEVVPVYRFFNTDTGSHLYTMNEVEKNYIQDELGNYNFEGIKYYAFESEPENMNTIPVYRMLNTQSGSHLFSSDLNEINHIKQNHYHFAMENNGNAAFYVFEL